MSGLFSNLHIGANALLAQQRVMQVIGNNIANVNTEGYSRERAELVPLNPGLEIGVGVKVDQIIRIRNQALDDQIWDEKGRLGQWEIISKALGQMEGVFNEPSDSGLQSKLSQFWGALSNLSSYPDDIVVRQEVIAAAQTLSTTFNDIHRRLGEIGSVANAEIPFRVDELNKKAEQIYQINRQILNSNAQGYVPGDILDQRDRLIEEVSDLADVNVFRNNDGTVSVYLGSDVFASNSVHRTLEAREDPSGDYDIFWADSNMQLNINDGKITGLIDVRDTVVRKYQDYLDTMANELIHNFNMIYSQGSGLERFSSVTSGYDVTDETVALETAAGIHGSNGQKPPVDGSFWIAVYDANGQFVEENEITVDISVDTLDDVRTRINTAFAGSGNVTTVGGTTMFVTANNNTTFSLVSSTGQGDTSGLLTALGINTFFQGDSANSIGVVDAVADNPALIAAAQSVDPGDNTNVLALSGLKSSSISQLSNLTINQYYESMVSELGSEAVNAATTLADQEMIFNHYNNQRQSISGVSLDEEMTNMVLHQHSYVAAAKFINTIDELIQTVLNMV
jgi:flagellar hook-associated protein 1